MRYRVLAPVALIVVFVGGCTSGSGGGDPTRTSTVTPPATSPTTPVESSPTPTHSTPPTKVPTTGPNVRPGEKPPTRTPLAYSRSTVGSTESAAFLFRAFDWAYATTNNAILRGLYLPSCHECERFDRFFSRARSKGEHVEGGRLSILSSIALRPITKASRKAIVDVEFKQQSLRLLTSSGHVVMRSRAAGRVKYRVYLRWRRNAWQVANLKQVVSA